MDAFGERGELLYNLESLLEFSRESAKGPSNQDSLFGGMADTHTTLTLEKHAAANPEEKLAWEKELLGLYISGHPLDKFRAKMEAKKISIANVKEGAREGQSQMIIGVVEAIREIRTKKGDMMAFVKIADFTGSMEAVFFPKVYTDVKAILAGDKCLAIEGTMSMRNDVPSLLADKVKVL
jgi:DNA polymerase-3 subunit alpha